MVLSTVITCHFRNEQEPGVFPELTSMVEDPNLQDIEGFSIFRGLKSDESASLRDDSMQHGGETGEMLHNSQESLLINDDSISSMDIDIGALEKVRKCLRTCLCINCIDETSL